MTKDAFNPIEFGKFVGKVENLLDAVQKRLDAGGAKFHDHEDRLAAIDRKIDGVAAQQTHLDECVDRLADSIKQSTVARRRAWSWWRRELLGLGMVGLRLALLGAAAAGVKSAFNLDLGPLMELIK